MKIDTDIIQRAIDAAPAKVQITLRNPRQDGMTDDDGSLVMDHNGHSYRYSIAVKTHLHTAMLDRIIHDRRHSSPDRLVILITDQIGNNHADLLIKAGIAFLDTAGNAFIDIPGLYIATTGKRLKKRQKAPSPGRAFQRTGLKLIFAFLTDPHLTTHPRDCLLNGMFRDITQKTGVSLGSIGPILDALQQDGFIVDNDDGSRLLVDRKNLLQKWCASYIDRIYLRQKPRCDSATSQDWWRDVDLHAPDCLWGGEIAAAKLTDFLKPQIATIYAQKLPHDLLLSADLRTDDDGSVQLRDPFWYPWTHAAQGDCTHPLLVYADLLASDNDRNIDTARRVYDRYLHQIIEAD